MRLGRRFYGETNARRSDAFTLIEVAVAATILVVGLAGILMICSTGLRTARALDRVHVDAGSLAAELSLTNKLEEGGMQGDFGDAFPGYRWTREIVELTNKLFEVTFVVFSASDPKGTASPMTIRLFRPESVGGLGK
jgi:hypothetical protein